MHKATGPEVVATLAVVALLGGLASLVRTTPANASDPPPIDCRRAFAAGFVSASAVALAPDIWLGFAVLVVTAIISASWLGVVRCRPRRWTVAAAAAAAVGVLTSRGMLAFLYDPLVGECTLSRQADTQRLDAAHRRDPWLDGDPTRNSGRPMR